MVDAGDGDFEPGEHGGRQNVGRFRNDADALGEHQRVERFVVAVAQRKAADIRGVALQGHAQDGGGVDEVDQPGVGAEFAAIACDVEDDGCLAQSAEDPAGADPAHADAALQGDLRVDATVVGVAP